jgi:hypothetical protein
VFINLVVDKSDISQSSSFHSSTSTIPVITSDAESLSDDVYEIPPSSDEDDYQSELNKEVKNYF